ncbi:hypothetical protein [Curtobacterium sp. MCBD17_040]|uniref:hypothetical protein n=1 Tax=Curtobacterium sp. MCBD17_040 TaxID=2175674 RepID=UPI000DAA0EB1|nr:hypothetical protein [Curtobacterium sp. MCBD17_040]WIB65470.1 hypothetical protein DEI94_19040 [Curtobacterium sp. MCBD17_040]
MTALFLAERQALRLTADGKVIWLSTSDTFTTINANLPHPDTQMRALEAAGLVVVDRSVHSRWHRLVQVTDSGWEALGVDPTSPRILPVGAEVIYTGLDADDLTLFGGGVGIVDADHTITVNGTVFPGRFEPFDLALAPGQQVQDRAGTTYLTISPRSGPSSVHSTWVSDDRGSEIRTILTKTITGTRRPNQGASA